MNLYAFCDNNPVNYRDPLGLWTSTDTQTMDVNAGQSTGSVLWTGVMTAQDAIENTGASTGPAGGGSKGWGAAKQAVSGGAPGAKALQGAGVGIMGSMKGNVAGKGAEATLIKGGTVSLTAKSDWFLIFLKSTTLTWKFEPDADPSGKKE